MIVCITEKPTVARDIAAILGATIKRDGYYEGGDYRITWTFGHLCTLKEPADYTPAWKHWAMSVLPMIPPRFGIKLIADKGIEKQFKVIESLVSKADTVINCGDAGQEGELIQRWVLQLANIKCPVQRLWISSLTDEAIKKGFQELKPEADFNNLYYAGLSRAIGDWVLGINATRLYTLRYGTNRNLLSVGRVQTPTLALIVKRHREILDFKPEDFYELKTIYRDTTFNATSGRFSKIEDANAELEKIADSIFTVKSVVQKRAKESAPRLFDLTSLQVECNRKWGWTADRTLQLIQSLYEKKVTTYPRVDTTYLPDDVYPKVPEILGKMTPYASMTSFLLKGKIAKSKKVFDNSKVTDHHAIIPTGESPARLVGDEKLLYHLIALRFIAAFYPDCVFNQTTVTGEAAGVEFRAGGKVLVEPGWRAVLQPSADEKDSQDSVLPPFTEGESGPHTPSVVTKTTQPPKNYTEGTLLRAMETAGKIVEDEELRDAMKENGIGRPSTRAAIIETLFKRRYIVRERKNIIPTAAGIELIDTIRDELLKSVKLTGIWENKLRRIERGTYSASEFIDELKQQITEIVRNVMSDNSAHRIVIPEEKKKEMSERKKRESDNNNKSTSDAPKKTRRPAVKSLGDIICPVCGKGHIIKGRTAYGCSEYASGCTTTYPFDKYPADLTPAKLASALKKIK